MMIGVIAPPCVSERELKKKWDSLRTQYSRYTKLMYGSDGRFFTPRQQWIMQRLKFLDPHIKRRSNYSTELDYEASPGPEPQRRLSPGYRSL